MKKIILLVAMLAFGASVAAAQIFPPNSWAERNEALEALETGTGEPYTPRVTSGHKPLANGESLKAFGVPVLVLMKVFGGHFRWVIQTGDDEFIVDANGKPARRWDCGNEIRDIYVPTASFRRTTPPAQIDTVVVRDTVYVRSEPSLTRAQLRWELVEQRKLDEMARREEHRQLAESMKFPPPRKSWLARNWFGVVASAAILGGVGYLASRRGQPFTVTTIVNGGSTTVVLPPPPDPPPGPSDGGTLPPSGKR